MRRLQRGWVTALLVLAAGGALAAVRGPSDLVVHEWGTFLVMQGSDGATLDGMYHEEHALPAFVHARSRDQLRLPAAITKGETPVIYFYTGRPQDVTVTVGFPRGIWTQWYPQASLVGPSLAGSASPPAAENGRITWRAQVMPPGAGAPPAPPAVSADSLWRFAREVDAAYVRTKDTTRTGAPVEDERFLFYRGLGSAPLPVRMTMESGGTMTAAPEGPALRHLFILRVENGRGAFRYVPELPAGRSVGGVIPSMAGAKPLPEFTGEVADALAARLAESGLYEKEARAMVNTWRTSYFHTDGIRALFVLPQSWTDSFIPMKVEPVPARTVRVMVGRLELLTPEREERAEAAVRRLASSDSAAREAAFAFLRDQGRYVEPILRRVLRQSGDPAVRTLCRRLLMTGFVTELRAAVHAPEDGRRVGEQRLYIRAQLASLLREVGLDAEARAEAAPVLAELRRRPAPRMDRHESRHAFRALARATEGSGDDAAAAAAYGQFVRFGAGVARCGGCHETDGPRSMAWFRDWWAGRKFARYALRAGQADRVVAESEAALRERPGDTAARMLLAYLYEARGEGVRSAQHWAKIEGGQKRQARGTAP